MRNFTLCADDYSQSRAITRGILSLVEMGRLDAVSSLTFSPSWRKDAADLRAAGSPLAGLHFNLTHPFGQPARRASLVLGSSLLGRIDRKWIRSSFERQWREFIREWHAPPDFIDGHQHVHGFPVIREVMIECLARLEFTGTVRTLRPPPGLPAGPVKQRLLERVTAPLAGELEKAGIRTNPYFAGFRPYRKNPGDFRQLFRSWLAAAGSGTLIMCHPGMSADDARDPIRRSRAGELDYLSSTLFEADRSRNCYDKLTEKPVVTEVAGIYHLRKSDEAVAPLQEMGYKEIEANVELGPDGTFPPM